MLQRATIPSQNILRLTLCLCHGTLLSVYHVAPATIVESENLTRLAIDLVDPASCCVCSEHPGGPFVSDSHNPSLLPVGSSSCLESSKPPWKGFGKELHRQRSISWL